MELSPTFETQFPITLRSFLEMLEKNGCVKDTIVKINVYPDTPIGYCGNESPVRIGL